MADFAGYVHVLARADGRIVARADAGNGFGVLADPVATGEGRFVVQNQGARVHAFRLGPLE
ncbi:MAG: hypothetical protein U5K43_14230 [Halofilum sp. (in: g-proteobacteria)]|nr:hypothetical protein [Halofilum sp. (in: g-proteobacteria)]